MEAGWCQPYIPQWHLPSGLYFVNSYLARQYKLYATHFLIVQGWTVAYSKEILPPNFKAGFMRVTCNDGCDCEEPLNLGCILPYVYEWYTLCLQLASSRGIEGLTNLDVFLVAREVEQSLACHDTSKCLSWCHDNKSKLRKLNSSLEFNVRMQEFIELIRCDRRMDAIR